MSAPRSDHGRRQSAGVRDRAQSPVEAALSLRSPRPRPGSARAAHPAIRPRRAGRRSSRVAGSGSVWPNQMPSTGWPWCFSFSARCFSPTRRCESTSTSSLNTGGAKPWPQTSCVQRVDQVGAPVLRGERAVGVQPRAVSVGGVQPLLRHLAQRLFEDVRSAPRATVQPAAIAWPPKRSSTPGMALGHQIERIAQVEAGDRAARALSSCSPSLARARRRRPGGGSGP